MVDQNHPATARYLPNGLQWHGWMRLDSGMWTHTELDTDPPDLKYTDRELIDFVSTCNRHEGPVCFNVMIFRDGTVSEKPVQQLARLNAALPSAI